MRDGADVIYQAPLADERWHGRADFLRKVAQPSELGAWSYEVVDAKLATETRAGTILQLCVYSTLLERLQGSRAAGGARRRAAPSLRARELSARRLRRVLPARETPARSGARRTRRRHLSRARAALRRLQLVGAVQRAAPLRRSSLLRRRHQPAADQGAAHAPRTSTRSSGSASSKTVPKPTRGSREALERTRDQAAIQLKARRLQERQHEVLPLGPEHGFLRLPEPARGDLFLDLEGDRLALDGGREYLFGVSDTRGGYTPLWATNPAEEKRAFERVVDRILAAFAADRAMHVYHFGAYEPTAFKRLSGRYATRETELDTILRAELFVDLHTIVRHSLRASVETYSLKDLEQFYGLARAAGAARGDGEPPRARVGDRDARGLGACSSATPAADGGRAKPQLELGLDASPRRERVRRAHRRSSNATTATIASPRPRCATGSRSCAPRPSARAATSCRGPS